MQTIAIVNQKGGSGKTATALALVQAAAYKGLRTLAIDLDPQGNLSFSLAADTTAAGSYELITGSKIPRKVIQSINGIDIIPASWNLSTISSGAGTARRLQEALKPINDKYDLIVIDTPPTAGELQYNAIYAASWLIIPIAADIYGLQGFYQITDTAAHIQANKPGTEIKGIIFTRHNARSTFTKQMEDTITAQAEQMKIAILGSVRDGIAFREASALQQNLYEYAPKSNPAKDYMAIFDKLMEDL